MLVSMSFREVSVRKLSHIPIRKFSLNGVIYMKGFLAITKRFLYLTILQPTDTKDEKIPKVITNDASLKIGRIKVRFHGGARYESFIF